MPTALLAGTISIPGGIWELSQTMAEEPCYSIPVPHLNPLRVLIDWMLWAR